MEINPSIIRRKFGDIGWEAVSGVDEAYSLMVDNKDYDTPVRNSEASFSVRVVLPNNKVGLASSSNPEKFLDCFTNAYKIAKVSSPREISSEISSRKKFSFKRDKFKKVDEKVLFNMLDSVKNMLNNKSPLILAAASKNSEKVEYYNSNGSHLIQTDSEVSASINIGEGSNVGCASSKSSLKLPSMKKVVNEALEHYEWSKNEVKISSGEYDVLFTPVPLAVVMQPVLLSLLGSSVVENRSNYAGKINNKILDSKISIFDNPRNKDNFSLFDAEGYKTVKTALVNNGVLKTFIHDSYTSRVLNSKNTFNSSSLAAKPSVSFFCPEIKGKDSYERMIKETDSGFILFDLYPEHVVNMITGAFGLNSLTFFYIEKGEIKGVIPTGVVTGNSFEIFKDVSSVSKESRYDLGSFNLPTIKTKAQIIV